MSFSLAVPSGRQAAIEKRKVYIGNLPPSMTSSQLTVLASELGTVQEAHVLDRCGKDGRLSSFVTFSKASEARAAIKAFRSWHPEGQARRLTVKYADVKGRGREPGAGETPRVPPFKLYVSNLPPESTSAYVNDIFEAFGPLTECFFLSCKGRGDRRTCFVTFETLAAATAAVSSLNNELFDDDNRLTVRWACCRQYNKTPHMC